MSDDQEREPSYIRTECRGDVGIITIDRPDRFNALDVRMAQDLRKAGLAFARDDAIRCVMLTGGERVFCSGADLKYVREKGDGDDLSYLQPGARDVEQSFGASFKQILEYIHSTISEIKRAPKPFIAAVRGVAAAGGFGLAMSCDLVFASDAASFEWAYHKTGLTGAESSTFFLPRLIGLRKTMELVLLNPRLRAQLALDLDLINGVFAASTFDDDVLAIAERLARGPTRSFGIAKNLINEAAGVDRLAYHLDKELRELARIADSPDFAEGIESFFGHRPAEFSGAERREGSR
jgi:2-(1,2-epoxy-1,2-dihydrophenyl)acetyl-CoA isomerase